jgi:hypothetical protein
VIARRIRGALLLAAAFTSGCASLASLENGAKAVPADDRTLFVPPPEHTLLIAGQDTFPAIQARLWLGHAGGFMTYTRLGPILGDAGQGPYELEPAIESIQQRAQRLPNSVLQLGLYVVGHLDNIRSGALDANIDRLIGVLKALERPVYLRFGYELDAWWSKHEPEAFKAAWLRFRKRLRELHADKVVMVWHVASDCSGTHRQLPSSAWYPGDAAVDWIGLSWFWPADCDYRAVREVLKFAREHGKPLMIAESTPRGYDLTALTYSHDGKHFAPRTPKQIWEEWYVPFLDFATANADVVRAVSYINENWHKLSYAPDYWGDARLQANPEILQRWRTAMRDPRWLRASPDLESLLTRPRP